MYRYTTDLEQIKKYIFDADCVAFDFETASDKLYRSDSRAALDAHCAHIVGVSFSIAENDAIYVPLAHTTGKNTDWGGTMAILSQFARNTRIVKIAHNLAFESLFLYAQGVVLQPPCYDTLAAAQLTLKSAYVFRTLGDCGLKTLVPELFQVNLPSFDEVTKGLPFDELDPCDLETVRYACADSDYALRLYHLFNGWFDDYLPKHRTIVEKVESPTAVYCGLMKYNGMPVDKTLMLQKRNEAEAAIQRLRAQIGAMTGGINIGENASTRAIKQYLYQTLNFPVVKTTAKCQESIDDEALVLIKDWCREKRPDFVPLLKQLQEYRRWGKIKSTYIDGYLSHLNPLTDRIHADLMPLATETGRFSARNPNLQNMPRPSADDVGVRDFFLAPDGCVLLSLDFSQIELRVGAFYCRDDKMLETYRSGGDIHAQTTAIIYHIPLEQAGQKSAPEYKERRTIAKNCNFGTFYGLFPKGLKKTLRFKAGLDVSLRECEKIISNLKTGYPGLVRWQEQTKLRARILKYSETWLGRRRYLPGIVSQDWGKKSFAERCALNTPIQGTAADILKLALGRIIQGLPARPWLKPLLQIHDELIFELPEHMVTAAVDFIKQCMEARPFPEFDVPIVADAAVGNRFGHLDELEDGKEKLQ